MKSVTSLKLALLSLAGMTAMTAWTFGAQNPPSAISEQARQSKDDLIKTELAELQRLTGAKVDFCEAPETKPPVRHRRKIYDLTTRSSAQDDTIIDRLFGTNASPSISDARLPLGTPLEYRSARGVLDVTLTIKEDRVQVGKYQINVASYNGEYAGPVLRVKPGDLVRVKLVNGLDDEVTNLHFHGLEVTPKGSGDNMMISVSQGAAHQYEFRIPATHRPGVYWYHSHMHLIAEDQVFDGLSGTLIIDPPGGRDFPQLREQLMVLKNFQASPSGESYKPDKTYRRDLRTINGQLMPRIEMRPGETQLWRFTNQAANLIYRITLKGHKFRVVARDGTPLPAEIVTDEIIIGSAGRVDVLVDAGDPGEYILVDERTFTGPQGNEFRAQNIGLVVVSGPQSRPAPPFVASRPSEDLANVRIDKQRLVVFTEDDDARHYFVNGRSFDHARIDTRVPLGNIEEWTIRNSSDELHVFHIHQVTFQVMEVNGVKQPNEGRLDSVIVPMWGEVKIRMRFDNPVIVGQFMYHCHILEHEDRGMMANIEVYDPKALAATTSPPLHKASMKGQAR